MLLVVFDIDGTLTASAKIHQMALLSSMNNYGLKKINTDWKSYKHFTDSWIFMEAFFYNFGKFPTQEECKTHEELFNKEYHLLSQESDLTEIPGASHCLKKLSTLKIPFCFATGSFRKAAEYKLSIFNQLDFSLIASASEVTTREQIVKLAIKKALNYYPFDSFEKIISVGDGIWDYKTARKLNLDFLGVGQGPTYELLHKEGVKNIISNFNDNSWRKILLV